MHFINKSDIASAGCLYLVLKYTFREIPYNQWFYQNEWKGRVIFPSCNVNANDDNVDIMTSARCPCISIKIIRSDMDTTGNQLNTIKQNKTWNMAYIPAWWCETLYFNDWEFQVLLIYYTFHRNYNESHVCNHILWYRYFIYIMLNMCPPPFRMTVNLHIHTPSFSVQLTVSRDTIELHMQTHTWKVWHRKQHYIQMDA